MTLAAQLWEAAQQEENVPGSIATFLSSVKHVPQERLELEGPELLKAIDDVQKEIRARMIAVGEQLAETVATRRGVRGFGAVKPSTRGQRLDRKA